MGFGFLNRISLRVLLDNILKLFVNKNELRIFCIWFLLVFKKR